MSVNTPLQAVLFDMDGVITDTAQAHAAAWQRLFDDYLHRRAEREGGDFRPFDPRLDYRRFVDGKSRTDGVRSFLASRGIDLPDGGEHDGPDHETVTGLGKRKDGYFQAWLDNNRVEAYPGSLRLIETLRDAGVRIAVFSASRNAEKVLRHAGVLERFDVKVDGTDLARLALPGKPDPAMLIEAARRLKTPPGKSAVIEDAIAGVEAGVRGAFGQVIGVARDDDGDRLASAGADLVVHDLSELCFDEQRGLSVKTLANLPAVEDHKMVISDRLSGKRLAVFLDYDGTLTPIIEDHTQARLAEQMRAAVAKLSRHCMVAIISGRDLQTLQALIDLETVVCAGSHGFEIAAPQGGVTLQKGSEFLPELDEAERELRHRLSAIEGHSLERKRFSIAVHYRQVAEEAVRDVECAVDHVLQAHPRLRRGVGKKVYEIRPDIDWHKGRAVGWILQRFGLEGADVVPLYVGDDITDEDAFRALAGRGVCIAVRDGETRQSAADYVVANTGEVNHLLEWLGTLVEQGHRHWQGGAGR